MNQNESNKAQTFDIPTLRSEIYRLTDERAKFARQAAHADKLAEALKVVKPYLVEQMIRRNKKSFADQRAGSDAQDLFPIVNSALAEYEQAKGGQQ